MNRHGDPRFYALLDEMAALHSNKNHDYATTDDPFSNFRRCEAFGIPAWKGVLARMSDKWSRIEQISNGKEPKNESLRDSLIDNAVYSLICVLLMEPDDRATMSYDEKREHPVECHCGRNVSQRCSGTVCAFERAAG
jgi:hypothetical protein